MSWLEPDWPSPPGVRALATDRQGGVSVGPFAALNLGAHVGDEGAAVAENRARLRSAAGLPSEPCWLEQVHGTHVLDLEAYLAPDSTRRPVRTALADAPGNSEPAAPLGPADAALTRQAGRICAVLTADCLPVLFASRDGSVIGVAHAGWRGLAAGVLEATVTALAAPPDRLLVWLGPAIGVEHFEVGAEVRAAFLDADPGAADAFHENARGRYQADLERLARRRLERAGVKAIFGGGVCTYAEPSRYFSHRRDGVTGRQATLIWRA